MTNHDLELRLWRWRYTDQSGKRRVTRYLLSESDAAARLTEAEKIDESLEIVMPLRGYFSPWTR